jgi:two-component system chemotaxis sensor kinase CheA
VPDEPPMVTRGMVSAFESVLPAMNDTELIKDFLVESYENLDRLDRELVILEKKPDEPATLASVFRTIHTIKGTCGFLGFGQLEKVAHVGENLLSHLRDGKMRLTATVATALLALVDAIREILSSIESPGAEGNRDDDELIATLKELQRNESSSSAQPLAPPATIVLPEQSAGTAPLGELLIQQGRVTSTQVFEAIQQQDYDPRHVGEILVEQGAAKSEDIVDALHTQKSTKAPGNASDSTIRVDVGLLDKLMNLVGELVLARNQILQFTNSIEASALIAASQRLNLITTELQEGVIKTRMQPIGNIWSKFPRTVRDVALSCGKEVAIEMDGKETEMDKTIIESIKDPLTHLVRNAVDHGIEKAEVRRASGKDPVGRVRLHAFHEGGQVTVEISDDGAGLDVERLRKKAIERAVVTPEQGARMTEGQIFNLIFLPGFSTAEKVTNVSGRGVGMDVVKTNVEKIGGVVDVQSQWGRGTTVRMKIPLTLAIIPALIVTCGGDRFAIPQVNLVELLHLKSEDVEKGIEMVHGVPVHRLRGQLLPLVYLSLQLGLQGDATAGPTKDSPVNIVVLQVDGQPFGLIVDMINDTEEIVVKPLRKQLKSIKVFAGASIMGDGRVALILDVMGIAHRSNVISEARHLALEEKRDGSAGKTRQKTTFLLFSGPDDSHMALPLDTVARLEELPTSRVEKSGQHWLTQYRGQLLPLVQLGAVLVERRAELHHPPRSMELSEGPPLQVLVCNHEGHAVGLVVENIMDIVEDSAEIRYPASRPGVLYSVVINDRTTELIDIPTILYAAGVAQSTPSGALLTRGSRQEEPTGRRVNP